MKASTFHFLDALLLTACEGPNARISVADMLAYKADLRQHAPTTPQLSLRLDGFVDVDGEPLATGSQRTEFALYMSIVLRQISAPELPAAWVWLGVRKPAQAAVEALHNAATKLEQRCPPLGAIARGAGVRRGLVMLPPGPLGVRVPLTVRN